MIKGRVRSSWMPVELNVELYCTIHLLLYVLEIELVQNLHLNASNLISLSLACWARKAWLAMGPRGPNFATRSTSAKMMSHCESGVPDIKFWRT